MVAASWRIYDWIKWMQYGTFVAENLWWMKFKDCWILLATSKEFPDGGTTMDGENIYIFLFTESGVRFFQLCLLNFLSLLVDSWRQNFGGKLRGNCGSINEDSCGWKLKKLWLHNGEFL